MNEQNFCDLSRRDTERHLLIAVDESDNSRRAVMYVADFFNGYQDVFVTLLSIIPEPVDDLFPTETERQSWLKNKEAEMQKHLAAYKEILLAAGFQDSQIETRLSIRPCTSIGDAILEEQEKLRSCIIIVGRRGISQSQEFLLGSTSSKIVHHARHCAVMVIE